jgi:membrane protein implicated in regulation of membrane protease activity
MDILWWHWLVLGLVLVAAELAAAGGFYIIFFGIGAIAVGVLAGFGVAGPVWMQMLLFSGLSVGTLLAFRGRLVKSTQMRPGVEVDALIGELAIAVDDLAPHGVGRVELRGTAWSARNHAAAVVSRGARCRVVRVEGLTLEVEPEGAR